MPNGTPYGERMIACALRLRRKPPSGFASPPNSCKDALAFVTETALCPAGTLSPKGTRARDANGFATLPNSYTRRTRVRDGNRPYGVHQSPAEGNPPAVLVHQDGKWTHQDGGWTHRSNFSQNPKLSDGFWCASPF
ncbi:hypothetical protein [Brasilonema octagenarum]|uniref:hypothetical protein n=1 Tax=Brasilonema octagenarum TaxID=417105 RepID=UPI00145CAC5D|nr:hypothetical protein [Brasilonema octagenarum]